NLTLVQRKQLDDDHVDSAFWVMVLIGICLWSIGFAVAPLFTTYFAEPRLTLVLQILPARLVFDAMQVVPLGLISRDMNFKILAIRSLFANVVSGVVGVALAIAGF